MSASVQRIPGVISADLNFASGTLLVEYEPDSDPLEAIVKAVEASGHGMQSLEEAAAGAPAAERPWLERNRAEVATIGSGAFSAIAAVLAFLEAPEWVPIVAYAIAIAFGGLLVWRRALASLRARILDMNVLMTAAVFGAVMLGEWGEAATVYFLFALGGLLESRSLERTRRSIGDLMDLTPQVARVLRAGAVVEVPVADVLVGETVTVRPGDRVPVDGVVSRGTTSVNEAPITGESAPVDKGVGDRVFTGTLNVSGLIEVDATAVASDSTLARIVYLVEEAQAAKAPSQTFVERFSAYYTPSVIGVAALIAVVPPLVGLAFGLDVGPTGEWIRRALVMLVVSCPCALVISTPVSVVSGITRASRDGVLVKGGAFLETAAKVRAVAFDKTGTLTIGSPQVAEVVALAGLSEDDVLSAAGTLESHSSHPIARAVRAAGKRGVSAEITEFVETAGVGVAGRIDGVAWEISSPGKAEERGALSPEVAHAVEELERRGRTTLVLLRDQDAVGVIGVADTVRSEAPAAIAALRRSGIEHLVMLTGDNERVGEAVTAETGLTGFLARLLPHAKTDAVRVLQQRYGVVAMVGDGVNDAPALAAADIGIAMGAVGSDTALETADVALMRDDLRALPGFFSLGRRTRRTIAQNVVFSVAVKALFLALAITGNATLWMAVFADTGVSLLVILNGMRLLSRAGSRPDAAKAIGG